MSLRAVNLNFIPVLRALLRYQSISEAAAAVNLSQPTVSVALARLRETLGDPLLVRVGRRMELTKRARDLIKPVEDACDALEAALMTPLFDASLAVRSFSISTSDHISALLGPPLVAALARQAPGITPHFIGYTADMGVRHRLGEVDLTIMPRQMVELFGYQELRIKHLFKEEFVDVIGPRHKLAAQERVTAAEAALYKRAIFSPSVQLRETFGQAYGIPGPSDGAFGTQPSIAAKFEQLMPLLMMAALGDMIVTIPRYLALRLQGYFGLRIIGETLPPIDICLSWSPILETDPAHRWFRTLLAEIAISEVKSICLNIETPDLVPAETTGNQN
jgi:DNA-binding transcriptional LysR family regulator